MVKNKASRPSSSPLSQGQRQPRVQSPQMTPNIQASWQTSRKTLSSPTNLTHNWKGTETEKPEQRTKRHRDEEQRHGDSSVSPDRRRLEEQGAELSLAVGVCLSSLQLTCYSKELAFTYWKPALFFKPHKKPFFRRQCTTASLKTLGPDVFQS